jgi:hypothetical protein
VIRCALGALAAVSLVSGVWASVSPRAFYDEFPGGGSHWVAVDGPYNEHLVRDFGALNLALTVVAVVAIMTLVRAAVVAAAGAWIAYTVPHLIHHVRHADVYDTTDKVGVVGALVLALVLPAVVLVVELRRPTRRDV